jgi:hypothetical protein
VKKIILGLGLVLLISGLGLVTQAKATTLNYVLTFYNPSLQLVGSGSFSFDAGSNMNTTIGPPVTLTGLTATLSLPPSIQFQGTSPIDDFVVVDGVGIVTGVHADLVDPLNWNSLGMKLYLYENLNYAVTSIITPSPTLQCNPHGTYTITDCEIIPVPGTLILVGTGLAGLWIWRRRRG